MASPKKTTSELNVWPAVVFALLVILIAIITWIYFLPGKQPVNEQAVCTLEAKLCPDGSYVGRIPPSCAFAECPTAQATTTDELADWLTFDDAILGVSFRYPGQLSTTYIDAFDWPPKIEVLNQVYECAPGGTVIDRAGETTELVLDGQAYCVTAVMEGAAGSLYTQYAFGFGRFDQTVMLTFSLRAPQCLNYDQPEQGVCLTEQTNFDISRLIDQIIQTMVWDSEVSVETGVSGLVLLGPNCPVETIPPDPSCQDRPYQTSLVITSYNGDQVIKEFSSDAQGKFTVAVDPGTYAIRSAAAANVLPYCSGQGMIKVVKGQITSVDVACDTGIR